MWKKQCNPILKMEFNALKGDTVEFRPDDLTENEVDFSKVY
jgi:hypothetical protein